MRMEIRSSEIVSLIKEKIEGFNLDAVFEDTGRVIKISDGVALLYGLSSVEYGELVEFDTGAVGMALNLEDETVGCVILSGEQSLKEGSQAKRTKLTVSVPVGEATLGRVLDPLGNPIDGRGPLDTSERRPIEFIAPGVIHRKRVSTPMETGILAIDSMIPIGRGQRELIIGDRQTGKTTIALDTILNQKGKDVICVYVAIGQKASSVASVVKAIEDHGARPYTIVVSAPASDSSPSQYIAPYSACAMAEYFMYSQHRDVLIVYDDLSKHAVAYRAMSLLLRRPPGREAYPGDVFYIHSRLLERAARVSDDMGGGSITALPIIETQAGDVSAYIPTNVISITDGQIYLESELFHAGVRPAVNVGLSVSRVGGDAQAKAMKKVSGSLRVNLAQYRELAVFARFGSDLDAVTKNKLSMGERVIETLKQPQRLSYSLADQVLLLLMSGSKQLANIPLNHVAKFNQDLLAYFHANCASLLDKINSSGLIDKESEAALGQSMNQFLLTI
jgi:F-type H+/Na+-transporting ATPase subunit alpha